MKRRGAEIGGVKKLDTKYSWRFVRDETRDLGVYEIRRSHYRGTKDLQNIWDSTETPFTVLIFRYSRVGDSGLFPALFYSEDWDKLRGEDGKISDDVQFCCELWEDLGIKRLMGPFRPEHIQWMEPPIIFRNTLENVMNLKYGCGHNEIVEKVAVCDFETTNMHIDGCSGNCVYVEPIVVPLSFDVNESKEEMYRKVLVGMKQGMERKM